MPHTSPLPFGKPTLEIGAHDVPSDVAGPTAPATFPTYTLDDARNSAQAAGHGLSTGFAALDAEELRWVPGKVYAVAGRQSEGKTSLLLELLMLHVESREDDGKGPAVFVSYEESLHHLYGRLLMRELAKMKANDLPSLAIPARSLMETWLRGESLGASVQSWVAPAFAEAAANLDAHTRAGRLALIDGDDEGGSIDQLTTRLTSATADTSRTPSLVVLDYFQKIRPPRGEWGSKSRQQQLQETSNCIRRYAKGEALGKQETPRLVPVIVGAQVNRDTVEKDGVTVQPELHHIREADDLANDAAGVLTIHRTKLPVEGTSEYTDTPDLWVKIVKNRDGRRGKVIKLHFDGPTSRVSDPAARRPVVASGFAERLNARPA